MNWKQISLFFALLMIGESSQEENLDWWQTTVIYQIYPKSFKDSNEDGIGDLKGIEEQAEYFKDTGIGAVWLSPIFKSPMYDMGYDISNFTMIDPIFGTMEDFVSLQKKLESLDIKLILDFVPNHSSDEHEWFQNSIKKIDPFTNYYVWKDPKGWLNESTPIPPNNWVSVFGGSAWKYHPERKQFYLHQFSEKQPDFNYRSKELVEEMKNVLRFFLDRGVNGMRTDSVPYLVEHEGFLDEPPADGKTSSGGKLDHDSLQHIYTKDQPESYNVVSEFRKVIDSYTAKGGPTRVLLTEAYSSIEDTIKYYGNETSPIAHIPFNFLLLTNLNDTSNAKDFSDTIHSWIDKMPAGKWPNWVIGNHDNPRVSTRFEPSGVDALNMLVLLLRGTAITYNGEEIGMEDTKIRFDQTTDVLALKAGPKDYTKVTRDPERTPFQWNSTLHSGFSKRTGNTWLPTNPNYPMLNLDKQKKDPKSHYSIYKELVKLRSNDVIQSGELKTYVISEWIFAFERSKAGEERYIVVLNLNNQEEYVTTLKNTIPELPKNINVFIASANSEYNAGDVVRTDEVGFQMRPKSGIVLQAVLRKEPPVSPLAPSSASSKSLWSKLTICGISIIFTLHAISWRFKI